MFIRRFFIFLLCTLPCAVALSQTELDTMGSDRLLTRSAYYIGQQQRCDSALLCLTTVMRRYYDNPTQKDNAVLAVKAMRSLMEIYWDVYHDYGSTFDFIGNALAIAEAEQLNEELPGLYLSLAWLYNPGSLAVRNGKEVAVSYIRKAYQVAMKEHNLSILPTIAIHICAFSQATGSNLFATELKQIAAAPIPPDAPNREISRVLIKVHKAIVAKRYAEAEQVLHQAVASISKGEFHETAPLNLIIMEADMCWKQGRRERACSLLRGYLATAESKQRSSQIQVISHKLSLIYEQAGMADSARHYHAVQLLECEKTRQNSLLTPQEMDQMTDLVSVNDKLRQNHILRLQREQQLLMVSSVLAIMLIMAIFIVRAWIVQRRNARILYAQNQTLLAQADHLQELRSEQIESEQRAEPQKYGTSAISGDMSAKLYQQLLHILDTSDAIYATGFRLDDLAALAGMPSHYVSQIINENSGDNFNQLLNQYRIREVQRRLRDKAGYGNITIEGVAAGVGFMSRSTFAKIFKRYTGLTPTQYRALSE